MPPRRAGTPPGPSSGPQAASSVADRPFPTLLDATVKVKPSVADIDSDALRRAFHNAWLSRPPPPNDLHAASALLVSVASQLARAARRVDDPFHRFFDLYHHHPLLFFVLSPSPFHTLAISLLLSTSTLPFCSLSHSSEHGSLHRSPPWPC